VLDVFARQSLLQQQAFQHNQQLGVPQGVPQLLQLLNFMDDNDNDNIGDAIGDADANAGNGFERARLLMQASIDQAVVVKMAMRYYYVTVMMMLLTQFLAQLVGLLRRMQGAMSGFLQLILLAASSGRVANGDIGACDDNTFPLMSEASLESGIRSGKSNAVQFPSAVSPFSPLTSNTTTSNVATGTTASPTPSAANIFVSSLATTSSTELSLSSTELSLPPVKQLSGLSDLHLPLGSFGAASSQFPLGCKDPFSACSTYYSTYYTSTGENQRDLEAMAAVCLCCWSAQAAAMQAAAMAAWTVTTLALSSSSPQKLDDYCTKHSYDTSNYNTSNCDISGRIAVPVAS
jgi:hypothetical protein